MTPITEGTARAALDHLSPDVCRDDWVRIAFALASEFGTGGFHLFDDWSRGGRSYDERATRATWKSVTRAKADGRRVTIGTLIAEAKRNGFQFEAGQSSDLARAERERRRAEAMAREQAEELARRDAAARAAMRAQERWQRAARTGASSYLVRKLIATAEAVRYEPNGTILVPMVRYDLPRESALVGVQAIRQDGSKRFGVDTAKRGSACRIGVVVVGEPILVGEGYATCMTLRAAVAGRLPVFVAFDAGNLEPVVEILQAAYPQCPILVCADDDFATTGNPGRDKADRLRRRHGVHMIYPVWPQGQHRGPKDTDFNDLHKCAGLQVVARQLRAPLRFLGYTGPLAAEITDAA